LLDEKKYPKTKWMRNPLSVEWSDEKIIDYYERKAIKDKEYKNYHRPDCFGQVKCRNIVKGGGQVIDGKQFETAKIARLKRKAELP